MSKPTPPATPEEIRHYYPGQDCSCGADREVECHCGVDWTPREVYKLRAEIVELKRAGNALSEYLIAHPGSVLVLPDDIWVPFIKLFDSTVL